MRIGLSFVGELARFEEATTVNTPDGLRGIRPTLVDELTRRGHRVFSLQKRIERDPYPHVVYDDVGLPDLDVLFCEYRWETYKGVTDDLIRQDQLLGAYAGSIPTIMYDAAYMINSDFEQKWPMLTYADPGIKPLHLVAPRRRLFFWAPLRSDFDLPARDPADLVNYVYIGNDYDRPDEFRRFYVEPSGLLRGLGVQTVAYGNWVDRSAARPDPGIPVATMPHVFFGGRWSFRDSMRLLNSALATTHICKPRYYPAGNITVRFAESLRTKTPGLVPSHFLDPWILGKEWSVESALDVVRKVSRLRDMSKGSRIAVIEEQETNLLAKYDISVRAAADFITSQKVNDGR